MIISGATAAVGSLMVLRGVLSHGIPNDGVLSSYDCLIYGGSGIAITGLAFNIVGNIRLKQTAETSNQQPGYALDFGAQQHGMGFALHF